MQTHLHALSPFATISSTGHDLPRRGKAAKSSPLPPRRRHLAFALSSRVLVDDNIAGMGLVLICVRRTSEELGSR